MMDGWVCGQMGGCIRRPETLMLMIREMGKLVKTKTSQNKEALP